jgi:hypothetical protein
VVTYITEPFLPAKVAYPTFWYIQLIMIVATLLFHYGLLRSEKAGGQAFVRYFMGATSVKLMLFMMIMIIYGLLNKESAFAFILHFFVFYLLYTIFEVAVSYKRFGTVRRKNP